MSAHTEVRSLVGTTYPRNFTERAILSRLFHARRDRFESQGSRAKRGQEESTELVADLRRRRRARPSATIRRTSECRRSPSTMPAEVQPASTTPLDLTGLAEWLVERGLRGVPLDEQVDGFCRRVVDAGFAACRFNMSIGTLHPRHGARSYVWRPGGLETEDFPRRRSDEDSVAYMRSPIYYLRSSGETKLRRRLDTGAPLDFPVLEELRDEGMTEYVARLVRYDSENAPILRTAAGRRRDPSTRPDARHLLLVRNRRARRLPRRAPRAGRRRDSLPGARGEGALDARRCAHVARDLPRCGRGPARPHRRDRSPFGAQHRRSDLAVRPPRIFGGCEPRAAGGADRDPGHLPRVDGAPGSRQQGSDPEIHGRRISRDVRPFASAIDVPCASTR